MRTARSLSSAGCWCPDPCLGVCCFDADMGYILPKNAASIKPRAVHPVVTFNYTNFFGKPLDRSVLYFHGRLDRFLRFDDRQVITNSRSLRQAVDSDSVIEFFDHVRLDVAQGSGLD